METTVGQLLINDALPEDLRDAHRVLDKKGVENLLRQVSARYPERYRDIVHKLETLGAELATRAGTSFSLEDIRRPKAKDAVEASIKRKLQAVWQEALQTPEKRDAKTVAILGDHIDQMRDSVYKESLETGNNFARMIRSGARGNPTQLSALRGGILMVLDHHDKPIPVPILNSYADGLSPAEYFAAAYGTRKGVIAEKEATAKAGFLCLAGGTLVRMADYTVKAIKDIKVGDVVFGSDMDGNAYPVTVTATFMNGVMPVHRFWFRQGRNRSGFVSLEATTAHKILAENKAGVIRREVISLDKMNGTRSAIAAKPQCTSFGTPESRALLLGCLLGDGDISGKSVLMSSADQTLIDQLNESLPDGMTFAKRNRKRVPDYEYVLYTTHRIHKYAGGDRFRHPIKQWLNTFGLLGKYCHNKFIPDAVDSWSNEAVASLLAGLFSTDGSVTRSKLSSVPSIKLGMTSSAIVSKVKELLQTRFGVYSSPIFVTPLSTMKTHTWNGLEFIPRHAAYTLTISTRDNILRFADNIRMIGKKQETLSTCVRDLAAVKRNDDTGFTLVSEEFVGDEEVYDIEVDNKDHLFVLANGLVVSNSKQLSQATNQLLVSNEEPLVGSGYPVESNDPDNVGSVLASDVGKFKAGTIITGDMLPQLMKLKPRILVHSPISAGGRGVPRAAAGVRERGGLSPIGDNIGISAAQAVGEPLSQSMLSMKHESGVARSKAISVGGFQAINQMVQVPGSFQDKATVADVDGRVDNIEKLPQGGYSITVGGKSHIVHADRTVTSKVGDIVEAGDVLSDGIASPAEIVKHKGIGEGRRYFQQKFSQLLKDSNVGVHRRNVELLSRGIINHVQLLEPDVVDGGLPDDIVSYDTLAQHYKPRQGARMVPSADARNKYLEAPALHYSIGTRITPSVQRTLKEFDVPAVNVHDEPPPFEPHMVRVMESTRNDPDFFRRLSGFYIGRGMLDAVQRGGQSEIHGLSWSHSLAQAKDFGKNLSVTGEY